MKKIFFSALLLGTLSVVSANAQSTTTQPEATPATETAAPATQTPAADPAAAPASDATVAPATDAPAAAPAADAAVAPAADAKVAITAEELPAAVKKTLKSKQYKGWTVSSANKMSGANEVYEIALKKDDEIKTVKLDKEGKSVE